MFSLTHQPTCWCGSKRNANAVLQKLMVFLPKLNHNNLEKEKRRVDYVKSREAFMTKTDLHCPLCWAQFWFWTVRVGFGAAGCWCNLFSVEMQNRGLLGKRLSFDLFVRLKALLPSGTNFQTVQPSERRGSLSALGRDTALLLSDLTQGASKWIQSFLDPNRSSGVKRSQSTPQMRSETHWTPTHTPVPDHDHHVSYPEGFEPLRSQNLAFIPPTSSPIFRNPFVSPLLAPPNLLKGLPPIHIVVSLPSTSIHLLWVRHSIHCLCACRPQLWTLCWTTLWPSPRSCEGWASRWAWRWWRTFLTASSACRTSAKRRSSLPTFAFPESERFLSRRKPQTCFTKWPRCKTVPSAPFPDAELLCLQ